MSEFKKAKCIELHDSNIAFTIAGSGYGETVLFGRTEEPSRPAFKINLGDLAMLGEMFGLNVSGTVEVPEDTAQSILSGGERVPVTEIDLPIHKVHNETQRETRESRIILLECEVVSAHLVNIRLTRTFDKPEYTGSGTLSYSGAFTVC